MTKCRICEIKTKIYLMMKSGHRNCIFLNYLIIFYIFFTIFRNE